ncbi:bifunctional glycosyltransferase/CDP-glycerol:glycerophosphate glycerophosphotransferase [Campylobacter devanensis]|uniref:bifunctional glycosyltransferase/CDP-glycerol:glycerophosphate glycerophosphotransferase n=1 Tax=Campylobacter devanensis TaxID=3161138 RepID=UPI000A332BD9|nr:glycosyltransferase family A protein [Campylobacter sp. P090]
MNKNIDVSIIIPLYNKEKFIEYTIKSVLNQTLKNFECIIVNDFSTDNSLNIAKKIINNDCRFKIINHKANRGLSESRNTGIRASIGRYITFLDADDMLMPDSLALRKNMLDKHKENNTIIGSYCQSVTIKEDDINTPQKKDYTMGKITYLTSRGNCPFNVNQPMLKRDLFVKFGGFNPKLSQTEDYDMWMKVLRSGYEFMPVPYSLVCYRSIKNSMIRNNPLLHLNKSMDLFDSAYKYQVLEKINPKTPIGYIKPLQIYFEQISKTPILIEFVGMSLVSSANDIDNIIDILFKEIPDYFPNFEYTYPFHKTILLGINRQLSTNKSLKEHDHVIQTKVDTIYTLFKNKCLENIQLPKPRCIDNWKNCIEAYPALQDKIELIFIPHKDYHSHTIKLMEPFLKKLGIEYAILDLATLYKDEGAIRVCKEHNMPYISYGTFIMGNFKPRAIAVFNDWEPCTRSIIIAAKNSGIHTIGIVEGINDYWDVDTGRIRKAYLTCKNIILPGEHDKKYFNQSDQRLYIGGVPRIYAMYNNEKQKEYKNNKKALINSNFSYNVLTNHRDEWLKQAVETCKKAGYEPVITRHPADLGTTYPNLVTKQTFYEALKECDILISRFASGILEAMADDKLPIYFNPHKEKVDKFKNPNGAYPVANTEDELYELLCNLDDNGVTNYKRYFKDFLEYHCGELDKDPADIISQQILIILNENLNPNYDKFYQTLNRLDVETNCLNNISDVIVWNSTEDKSNEEKYEDIEFIDIVQNLIIENDIDKALKYIKIAITIEPNNKSWKELNKLCEIIQN